MVLPRLCDCCAAPQKGGRNYCVEQAAKLIGALRRDVLQFTSPLGFDVVSPGLAVSFPESSCRSKFVNRSGKGSSCWTRYSSRSSSAIAARIMARSSLCLRCRSSHGSRPSGCAFYKAAFVLRCQTCTVSSVSVSRHGWSFRLFRHSRNS